MVDETKGNGTKDDVPEIESATIEALERLVDIPVEVTVELGRKKVTVHQLLALTPGSVIELNKVSGDPLDLVVGNRLIARGEAVVVGDRYGIRITEVIMDTKTVRTLTTEEEE